MNLHPASADGLFAPAPEDDEDIDTAVVKQAIAWLVALQSGASSQAEFRACAAWRSADARHEQAWQRLHALSNDLRSGSSHMTPPLLRSVLRNSEQHKRRVILKAVFGFTLIGGTATIVRQQPAWQSAMAGHRTATGEQSKIVLADGTRIMLNTATAIDVRYDTHLRQVTLYRGEILIETAADAAGRPFEIITANGSIRPIGTRFTVRHQPSSHPNSTAVAVLEGAVNITPLAGTTIHIRAGEQTRFTPDAVLSPFAIDDSTATWTDGMLVVERMRLIDFVSELDRYRPGVLRCDPAVAGLLVSGSFPLQDPDAVLALLAETLSLQVRSVTRYWTTISAG